MRLITFFNIPSQVDTSLHVKLTLEMDTRKLSEDIEAGGANPAQIDVSQPKLRATF